MSSAASSGACRQFGRYSLAGVVNTILGYAIIFGGLALGFSPYASNLVGYVAGLACSFFLNKTFVFASHNGRRRQLVRFLAAFAVAYIANLMTLHACLQAATGDVAAQVIAGIVYLLTMFIVLRSWVFRK